MIGLVLFMVIYIVPIISFCLIKKMRFQGTQMVLHLLLFILVPFFGPLCVYLIGYSGYQADILADDYFETGNAASAQSSWADGRDRDILPTPAIDVMLLGSVIEQRAYVKSILCNANSADCIDVFKSVMDFQEVETTHYATVALVELQKNHEQTIRMLQKQYKQQPYNSELLQQYMQAIWNYITSDILDGSLLESYRTKYDSLFDEDREISEPDSALYCNAAINCMELGNYKKAENIMRKGCEIWPDCETFYLCGLCLYAQQKNAQGVLYMRKKIAAQRIPISADGRKILDLWNPLETEAAYAGTGAANYERQVQL